MTGGVICMSIGGGVDHNSVGGGELHKVKIETRKQILFLLLARKN